MTTTGRAFFKYFALALARGAALKAVKISLVNAFVFKAIALGDV
jgi:hypothetical protein